MAVRTQDLFGAQPEPLPADPGSYGLPPSGARLPDGTRLGPVRLRVADLTRSLAFYEQVLGLRVIAREAQVASLAAQDDERVLVILEARAGTGPSRRGRLGLYHFAILLPDRPSLGRFVQHLAGLGVGAGAGDHLVSEAFYLSDPDGLGIEVYADRPRDTWRRIGRELMLATDPVDVPALVAAAAGSAWRGMPAGTVIGHVHLHVGDLDRAASFYADGLGFDRMTWSYPGALFLGAGGYHHHLGTNTWSGPNAQAPAADEARLIAWTIELRSREALQRVAEQLTRAGHAVATPREGVLLVSDPWGTQVELIA